MRKNPTQSQAVDVGPRAAPISLVTLANELDMTVAEVASRYLPEVFVERATGLRCVDVEVCKNTIDEHAAAATRRAAVQREAEAKILASLPTTRYVADEHMEGLAASALRVARQ